MSERLYEIVKELAAMDAVELEERDKSYGSSWKQRGGVGAFMMLARKWDRIENLVKKHGYDIFSAVEHDPSPAGIIDDIRDLRRYLLLVEAEVTLREYLHRPKLTVSSDIEALVNRTRAQFPKTLEALHEAEKREARYFAPEPVVPRRGNDEDGA